MLLLAAMITSIPAKGHVIPIKVKSGDFHSWQLTLIRQEASNGTLLDAGIDIIDNETIYYVAGTILTTKVHQITDYQVSCSLEATYQLMNGTILEPRTLEETFINRNRLADAEYVIFQAFPYCGFTTTNVTLLEQNLANYSSNKTTWLNYTIRGDILSVEGEFTTPDNNLAVINTTYDLTTGWVIYHYLRAWRPEDSSVYLEYEVVEVPTPVPSLPPPVGINVGDSFTWELLMVRDTAPNGTTLNASYIILNNETIYFGKGSRLELNVISINDSAISFSMVVTYVLVNGSVLIRDEGLFFLDRHIIARPEYLVEGMSPLPFSIAFITTTNGTLLEQNLVNYTSNNLLDLQFSFQGNNSTIGAFLAINEYLQGYINGTYDLTRGLLTYQQFRVWPTNDTSRIAFEYEMVLRNDSTETRPSQPLPTTTSSKSDKTLSGSFSTTALSDTASTSNAASSNASLLSSVPISNITPSLGVIAFVLAVFIPILNRISTVNSRKVRKEELE